ncbi:MAG: tryptophan--tRNA ligase, partial [bacterium]
MTRDIAISINATAGETFIIPEPEIPEEVATVPGIDGQKMSKSYDNTIKIFCTEEELRERVMCIKTDSTPVMAPKNPDTCILFAIYSLFVDEQQREQLRDRYLTPGLKYSDVKKELFSLIWEYFSPYRKRREALVNDRDAVHSILTQGARKAREIGSEFLSKARHNAGLDYWT